MDHPHLRRSQHTGRSRSCQLSVLFIADVVHLGMDVHKDSISVGILNPGNERPDVEKIFNDAESVRRLIARFEEPGLRPGLL